jgi:hypothetical protein
MGRTGIGLLMWLALVAPVAAQTTDAAPAPVPPGEETRTLLEAARETAKATRESVDYARVVPDILQQILAKLDKIEDKLDKVENAIKAQGAGGGRKR